MLVLAPVALIGGEKNIREFCCFKATAEGTRVKMYRVYIISLCTCTEMYQIW